MCRPQVSGGLDYTGQGADGARSDSAHPPVTGIMSCRCRATSNLGANRRERKLAMVFDPPIFATTREALARGRPRRSEFTRPKQDALHVDEGGFLSVVEFDNSAVRRVRRPPMAPTRPL
jgi:hypothetical protein